MALIYIAARMRQYTSFEEILDRAFFMSKVVTTVLLYMTEPVAALRWGILAVCESPSTRPLPTRPCTQPFPPPQCCM